MAAVFADDWDVPLLSKGFELAVIPAAWLGRSHSRCDGPPLRHWNGGRRIPPGGVIAPVVAVVSPAPPAAMAEQVSIFNKFDDPYKFWRHQLSFKENEIIDLEQPLYTEEDASQVMRGFLNGLNNIHEANYIHRDIKPENLILAPKGQAQDQELKIIDFGFGAK